MYVCTIGLIDLKAIEQIGAKFCKHIPRKLKSAHSFVFNSYKFP